jgi:hypothetical protein
MAAPIIYPSSLGFTWGITTEETGMAVETVRQNDTTKVFEQPDNAAQTIAVVSYDPKIEITVTGDITGSFSWVAGTPITLANLITQTSGPFALGLVLCKSIEITQGREAMKKATVNATMYPLIAP